VCCGGWKQDALGRQTNILLTMMRPKFGPHGIGQFETVRYEGKEAKGQKRGRLSKNKEKPEKGGKKKKKKKNKKRFS